MNRMMIDFETLDTEATAVVLSCGITIFNDKEIVDSKYYHFHVGGQIAEARTVSLETIAWWAETAPVTFRKLCTGGGDKLEYLVNDVLSLIKEFKIKEIWSRGSMDFLILSDIMEDKAPRYNMARDVRTLDSFGIGKQKENEHHALKDAVNQTEYVQEVLAWIERCRSAQSAEA